MSSPIINPERLYKCKYEIKLDIDSPYKAEILADSIANKKAFILKKENLKLFVNFEKEHPSHSPFLMLL